MVLFRCEVAPIECCIQLVQLIESIEPEIELSIGLHGGAVNLCALGYHERMEVTAIADAVNIAARLEHANRRYHTQIMTTERAIRSARHLADIQTRPLGPLQIRGRTGRVNAFQVMAKPSEIHAPRTDLEKVFQQVKALNEGTC